MTADRNWWQTFFSGLPVEMWLRLATEEMTRPEVDFVAQVLGVSPPARILDVPCGGGRHAIALAARGFAVTGVDLSGEFLAAARAMANAKNARVGWCQSDMRELPFGEPFDGACCLGNSFGYLGDDGDGDFLRAVARALKPGARFVLDTSNVAEVLLPQFQERGWSPVGDILYLAQRRYDCRTGRMDIDYTFIKGTEREVKQSSQRVYGCRELCGMMEAAGFADLQLYGGTAREPFALGSRRLFAVATRA